MSTPHDLLPAVFTGTTQGSSILDRWSWTERAVWTERMLTALETGVKGGVWFTLIDKVWTVANLSSSFRKVLENDGAAGVDHVSVEDFARNLDANLKNLTTSLRAGTYQPQAIRSHAIPKPGSTELRMLGIPTVRDRVVQGAIRHVIEPIFEKTFAEQSYGFRPGRDCKMALRRLDQLLEAGYVYVVDIDLKSYFDTISKTRLLDRLREHVADGRLLSLIEAFLKAGVLEDGRERIPTDGVPQGSVLGPLLSNIYLNPLDHLMASAGYQMIRYADDMVIVCRSQAEAEAALTQLRQWCEAEGLTVHPTKTRIVDVRREGFDFLGFHFTTLQKGPNRGLLVHWASKKSEQKLRTTIRGFTKRKNAHSLPVIIRKVNEVLN